MLKFFTEIYRIRELREKVLFILGIFLVFRVLAAIPLPGIDLERLRSFINGNPLFSMINVFSGGAYDSFSMVMLGLGPYITAIIIFQLLTILYPRLKEIYFEEGESGRQKFYYYSKIATVPLSILQAYGFIALLQNQQIITNLTPSIIVQLIATATAGSMILVWLSELITEKGLGNGASLMIFAGIVANLPVSVGKSLGALQPEHIPGLLFFVGISLFVVAGVIFINEAQRLIPVTYAKNVRGRTLGGAVSSFIPLRINMAGVIPIIFAMSLILFPAMIGNILTHVNNPLLQHIGEFFQSFQRQDLRYALLYFILVFFFTFFYTAITFEPKEVAQNLQKMGGFIAGIRPGEETARKLSTTVMRITLPGALALGLIAVLPNLVQSLGFAGTQNLTIGGTSVLIVVSVILETYKQIKAQISMREYERL